MRKKRTFRGIILNLFDGSGAGAANGGSEGGGDGASTNSADPAAAQRGRDLGLSDDLLDDYTAAFGKRENRGGQERGVGEQTDEETENSGNGEESGDLDAEFEELVKGKYKDAFHKRVGKDVKDRVDRANRDRAELESKVEKSNRVLGLLAAKYGSEDPDTIYNALRGDNDLWRQNALDTGQTVEDIINGIDSNQAAKAQQAELESLRQYKAANELNNRLQTLAAETRKTYPDFNLEAEFKNPKFRGALDFIAAQNEQRNRDSGTNDEIFDVTYAYELAHADELRANTIKRTAKAAASAAMQTMQANRSRPQENAAKPTTAAKQKSYGEMSDKEFADYVQRVKLGEARI